MSDELEKESLRLQRDLAMNVAEGTLVERDIALAQRNRLAAEQSVIAAQRDAAIPNTNDGWVLETIPNIPVTNGL